MSQDTCRANEFDRPRVRSPAGQLESTEIFGTLDEHLRPANHNIFDVRSNRSVAHSLIHTLILAVSLSLSDANKIPISPCYFSDVVRQHTATRKSIR